MVFGKKILKKYKIAIFCTDLSINKQLGGVKFVCKVADSIYLYVLRARIQLY